MPASGRRATQRIVTGGLLVYGVYQLALASLMAISPHDFFTQVGPFGIRNDHYIRDSATYNAAIGFALLVGVGHRRWRLPVLALVAIQFALHTINHLVDIGAAHPRSKGTLDFVVLALATVGLGWMLYQEARERRASL